MATSFHMFSVKHISIRIYINRGGSLRAKALLLLMSSTTCINGMTTNNVEKYVLLSGLSTDISFNDKRRIHLSVLVLKIKSLAVFVLTLFLTLFRRTFLDLLCKRDVAECGGNTDRLEAASHLMLCSVFGEVLHNSAH